MDPEIRYTKNGEILGASLVMFGLFVSIGEGLRFAITKPLFSF